MSSHGPGFPNSIEYSANSYDTLREAQESQLAGLGVLTPYVLIKDNKQVQIKVDGYDDEPILDMDTAKLFLGTLLDPTSGSEGGTYPYAGDEVGDMGGPTKAWPLRFQRIHFWATKGSPTGELPDAGSIGNIAEYYTYALCGQPVRVNPAISDANDCANDEDEESLGTVNSWNSQFDTEGNYDQRIIIGGFPGKTGRVVKEVTVTGNGCYVDLKVKYGVCLLLDSNDEYEQTRITYNKETLEEAISDLCSNVELIGTELTEFIACASANTAGSSGHCRSDDPCAAIENLIDCITGINLTGLIDCDDILYCP